MCAILDCPAKDVAYHELVHLWDFRDDGALSRELDRAVEVVRNADRRVDVDDYHGRKAPHRYLPSGKSLVQQYGDCPRVYFDTADLRLLPANPSSFGNGRFDIPRFAVPPTVEYNSTQQITF